MLFAKQDGVSSDKSAAHNSSAKAYFEEIISVCYLYG